MVYGIVGIVIALIIFLYGAYKNVSTLYLAPLCGVIVAVSNGLSAVDSFTVHYIGGVTGMILSVFPTIFLGALFGKVLTDCGAAASIANFLSDKLIMSAEGREKQAKRAVLALELIGCIFAFGGVDGFVAVFATFPMAVVMAKRIDIPRRFIPAMLTTCCVANSAPFVLSINNILCMEILQTSPGAAAIPGFICFFVGAIGTYLICTRMLIGALRKGETFDFGGLQKISGEDAGSQKHPNFIISLIPLLAVFILFATVKIASLALLAGIILAIILMSQYFPKNGESKNVVASWMGKIIGSLNEGAVSGAQSLMIICAAAGFAGVVQQTAVFGMFVGKAMALPLPPLVVAIVLLVVIVAFTSSPPAALGVALPIIAGAYIWSGANAINPDALARVSAFAVSTFETLPVNGLILLTTGLAQVKIKDAYLPMFLQTCIVTTIITILCAILVMVFPGIV